VLIQENEYHERSGYLSLSEEDLTTLLNNLPLPITIIQQVDPMGVPSYTWRWYKYGGSKPQFVDAMNEALTATMNTVKTLLPPGK
jgi:hypothetical protein